MTVTYNAEIHTVSFLGFLKLLLRWKGSIYKLLWKDFCMYAIVYAAIAFVYHFALSENNKVWFETLFDYFSKYQDSLPVSFVLGFYVSAVIARWWEQFNTIPQPSRLSIFVTAHIRGQDERSRLIRRTILRYACLGIVMTMKSFCIPVKKRFPTLKHLTESGMLLANEQKKLESLNTPYNKYYVPFIWATTLIAKSRKSGLVKDNFGFHCMIDEVNVIRFKCQTLMNMDWINIPLVYTQVASLTVYIYFLSCLFSRQFIPVYTKTKKPTNQGEVLIPIFTFLQYLFYMGWLEVNCGDQVKYVAENLMNPFGEDDDDFEVNAMIDKNLKTSYLIVDDMHQEVPELLKDQHWHTQEIIIPYTEASLNHYKDPHMGTVETMKIPEEKQCIINFSPIPEDSKSRNLGIGKFSIRKTKKNHAEKGKEKDDKGNKTIVPDKQNQNLEVQMASEPMPGIEITPATDEGTTSFLDKQNQNLEVQMASEPMPGIEITSATDEGTTTSDRLNIPGSTDEGKFP